jgi:hypothetical protein
LATVPYPGEKVVNKSVVLIIAMLAASPAPGLVEVRGARFADAVETPFGSVPLRGAGTLYYRGLIPVYAAALYRGGDEGPTYPWRDVAMHLEVEYFVNAPARRFTDAGDRILRNTFGNDRLAAIRERLDRMNRLFPDARAGDRCAITYQPSLGTSLTYNGHVLGMMEGSDFAELYFAIWLGPEPASDKLRNQLEGWR